MVKPHEILSAYHDNQRHNQIGGENDGIDAAVMADIGYETADRTREILANMGRVSTDEVVLDVKPTPAVCGDCGRPLPCQHGNGRRTFGK